MRFHDLLKDGLLKYPLIFRLKHLRFFHELVLTRLQYSCFDFSLPKSFAFLQFNEIFPQFSEEKT